MRNYLVIELNAATPQQVPNKLVELNREGWSLVSISVNLDEDGARYYTILVEAES